MRTPPSLPWLTLPWSTILWLTLPWVTLPWVALPWVTLLGCQTEPLGPAADGGLDRGVRCGADADCDDGDPCTRDRCVEGRCLIDRPPEVPLVRLATLPVEGTLTGLHLADDQLWTTWQTDRAAGLTTWDLSTLPTPTQAARRLVEADEGRFGVLTRGGERLFVAESPARVRLLGPDGASLGVQRTADGVQALAALPGSPRVVAAVFGKGLEVLGFGDPASPRRLARLATPGRALDLVLTPDRWYVADGLGGLLIVDGRDVTDPRRLGEPIPTAGRAVGVAVRGDLALLAESGAGLGVIDLRAAPQPARRASLSVGASVEAVAFLGDGFAVAAADTAGLLLIDLLRPDRPQIQATLPLPGPARQLAVDGGRVAVGHGAGLSLFGLSCAPRPEDAGPADATLDAGLD